MLFISFTALLSSSQEVKKTDIFATPHVESTPVPKAVLLQKFLIILAFFCLLGVAILCRIFITYPHYSGGEDCIEPTANMTESNMTLPLCDILTPLPLNVTGNYSITVQNGLVSSQTWLHIQNQHFS